VQFLGTGQCHTVAVLEAVFLTFCVLELRAGM
jgi:hypothetical protein